MEIGDRHYVMWDNRNCWRVHIVDACPGTDNRPFWRMRCGVEDFSSNDLRTTDLVTCLRCQDALVTTDGLPPSRR